MTRMTTGSSLLINMSVLLKMTAGAEIIPEHCYNRLLPTRFEATVCVRLYAGWLQRSFAARRDLTPHTRCESPGVKVQGREQTPVRAPHFSMRKRTTGFPYQVTRHILRKLSRRILSQTRRCIDCSWQLQPMLSKLCRS